MSEFFILLSIDKSNPNTFFSVTIKSGYSMKNSFFFTVKFTVVL
jgi:hypothetical protein